MAKEEPTYPSRRPRVEWAALGLVLLVIAGIPLAILVYAYGLRPATGSGAVKTFELTARLPTQEQGGWSPETIEVRKGDRVRLRLTSDDVVHGFTIPKLGVDAGWIEPGKVKEVEFVAGEPGRYTFLCTVWCESGHWRMRGDLVVSDPDEGGDMDPSPPSTDWMAAGLDIDAPHLAEVAPAARPDAARGQAIWESVSTRSLAALVTEEERRRMTPEQAFRMLGSTDLPEAAALAALTETERWDIVAAMWAANVTPEDLMLGARLYERDCTGCHGAAGRGDGPGAELLNQAAGEHEEHEMEMASGVVDFTDLRAQTGAPDLLYYGKLVRGGMGTSMPYWGTVYREQELWAVIAHLRSLGFSQPQITPGS